MLGLYIHIPFCKRKCLYCDFPSFDDCQNEFEDYTNSLIEELKEKSINLKGYKFDTIFIGGGTPSFLPTNMMGKIIDKVLNLFDIDNNAEITIEANPGTVSLKSLREYKSMYINRISMGLQAWQKNILKTLGRIHTSNIFRDNFLLAREVGFENINVDLMFTLPNQTIIDWEETLTKVIELKPEHISAYSLIIEEGTPFKNMYDKKIFELPDEILDRKMYYLAKEILKDYNYNQYEISNFAINGYECKHNIKYWECEQYIGVGLSSHSYFDNKRFNNTYNMRDYIQAKGNLKIIVENIESLSIEQRYEEFMFMGLRMIKGIEKKRFKRIFKVDVKDIYKNQIDELIYNGLLKEDEKNIYLTEKGIDISNFVFEKFIF